MVTRGAASREFSQLEWYSSRSGQGRVRDAVGGSEVSIRDSEYPLSTRLYLEVYPEFLLDSFSFNLVDKEDGYILSGS